MKLVVWLTLHTTAHTYSVDSAIFLLLQIDSQPCEACGCFPYSLKYKFWITNQDSFLIKDMKLNFRAEDVRGLVEGQR